MVKPIRRSLARRLGRNIGDRRRAVGLTQEQLAEYLEIDTLTVSRYETGNILPHSPWWTPSHVCSTPPSRNCWPKKPCRPWSMSSAWAFGYPVYLLQIVIGLKAWSSNWFSAASLAHVDRHAQGLFLPLPSKNPPHLSRLRKAKVC